MVKLAQIVRKHRLMSYLWKTFPIPHWQNSHGKSGQNVQEKELIAYLPMVKTYLSTQKHSCTFFNLHIQMKRFLTLTNKQSDIVPVGKKTLTYIITMLKVAQITRKHWKRIPI
jgi:hypothetical protein